MSLVRAAAQVLRFAGIAGARKAWRAWQAARLVAQAGATRRGLRLGADVNVQNPQRIVLGSGVSLGDQAELLADAADAAIEIGNRVKIGRRCQLGANPGHIRIGDHASLHSNVVLLGWVSVGRYSLLSANIFASSGSHRAFDAPEQLIRDQDIAATRAGREVKPVVIEEDCWLGWGAVVMSGVHVGRGAVIGSNAVVTKDVPPYAVMVGQPARWLRNRLPFAPPEQVLAERLEDGPYLYRGFLQLQQERQAMAARHPGHVGVLRQAVLVMSDVPGLVRLAVRGVTLLPGLSLQVQHEGHSMLIALPAQAGASFALELDFLDVAQSAASTDAPPCRVPAGRVFYLDTVAANGAQGTSAAWALHGATLVR